jgi:hypothetical protein
VPDGLRSARPRATNDPIATFLRRLRRIRSLATGAFPGAAARLYVEVDHGSNVKPDFYIDFT